MLHDTKWYLTATQKHNPMVGDMQQISGIELRNYGKPNNCMQQIIPFQNYLNTTETPNLHHCPFPQKASRGNPTIHQQISTLAYPSAHPQTQLLEDAQ